ncbi:MAG: PTS system mannose/fructose/sorbose family transporter subunit IID [Calditrichaeota bacterium]|nr:PTS system mannose/fructose/sorbose family transporter subunit IID [Calditrichota bacterium]MCB9391827.1 PTS system mannose/fructose/sorbose family transporter subunit IID [Calditrichota bacterium]
MSATAKNNILFRSLALQLFLNYKTMQGPGYLFALRPELRDADEAKIRAAASFINGHPVFSSAALGALSGMLREESDDVRLESLKDWKRQLSTPLGAIGDSLIWERFKPMLLAGVAALLLVLGDQAQAWWLKLSLSMIVVYTGGLWWFRSWAFDRGVELKGQLTGLAAHAGLPRLRKALRVLGLLGAASVLAASASRFAGHELLASLQFAAGFLIMLAGAKLRVSTLTAAFFTILSVFSLYFLFHS